MSDQDIRIDNVKSNNLMTEKHNKNIKYSLIKKIGYGSFSEVYLSKDTYGNHLAIKRIDKKKLVESRIETFLKELSISEILDHQNIIKCYDTFKTNNYWYIVLEYCDYYTLHEHNSVLKKMEISNLKEELVRFYLIQFRQSLEYLKSQNIVHRDLKPKNILFKIKNQENNLELTADFLVNNKENIMLKLADFTFARYIDDKVESSGETNMNYSVCGSPLYMAPELFLGKTYNIKADLWSFGVIMYEMLFGSSPYMSYGPNSISKLSYLMQTKQIKYLDGYSEECYNLLKSLLVLDPVNRISWEDFFNHPWFKLKSKVEKLEQINIGIEFDSENNFLVDSIKKDYDFEEIFQMDEELENPNNNSKISSSVSSISSLVEIKKLPEIKINNKYISVPIQTGDPNNSSQFKIDLVDDWFRMSKDFDSVSINKIMSPPRNIVTYQKIYDSDQYSSVIGSVSGSVINILSKTMNNVISWAKSF